MKALSAALFTWHEPDLTALRLRLEQDVRDGKLREGQIKHRMSNTKYLAANCRRAIPNPEVLSQRLNAAYDDYATKTSVELGHLFTEETSRLHQRTLQLVDQGLLSGGLPRGPSCIFGLAPSHLTAAA